MKEVIFVLLNGFADWEGAFTAICLNQGVKPGNPINYKVKYLSITKEPVTSILIVPLVKKALKDKKLVAGICNASVFLGMHGFLNEVKHTSNTLDYLKQYAGDQYTGESNYINKQAVRDENIVTANGIGQLEFCREILYALEADTAEAIEESYLFYKNGVCPKG